MLLWALLWCSLLIWNPPPIISSPLFNMSAGLLLSPREEGIEQPVLELPFEKLVSTGNRGIALLDERWSNKVLHGVFWSTLIYLRFTSWVAFLKAFLIWWLSHILTLNPFLLRQRVSLLKFLSCVYVCVCVCDFHAVEQTGLQGLELCQGLCQLWLPLRVLVSR